MILYLKKEMEENYKENDINENQKPLLDIDNDLVEMSKSLKIITSLKNDIDDIIKKNIDIQNFNKNDISLIEDKYNKIKKHIQKFMNKKNYIYNFIRIENNSQKNNINSNDFDNEEIEILLKDNKMENAMDKIKSMQNELKNKINNLDDKITKLKILGKKEPLIEEINKNDINETNFIKNNNNIKLQKYQSLSNAKAYKYNEETKELQNVVNKIEILKETTNQIKMIGENQGNEINYLKDINVKIENNLDGGLKELYKTKKEKEEKNKNLGICIFFMILIIMIFGYIIYNKIFKKK